MWFGFFNEVIMKKLLQVFLLLIFSDSLIGQNGSPYDCINNHLEYLQPDQFDPLLSAQSFYGSDSLSLVEYAKKLKQVYDGKGLYVFLDDISTDHNYFDSLRQRSVFYPFPSELPKVYVRSIDGQWYYPNEVRGAIDEYHQETYPLGLHLLMNALPHNSHTELFGVSLWQIIGSIILIALFVILFFLFKAISMKGLKAMSATSINFFHDHQKLFQRISTLISALIALNITKVLLPGLQFGPKTSWLIISFLKVITALLIMILILKVVDIIYQYFYRFTKSTSSKMDEQLLPVLKRAVQIILLSFWLIYLLTLFNVDVTALLAGISIGGVAIALAAQDTIKNLFGSVTIFMDKPFQIGDWIKFGEVEGTVEEVGFRSTRIRSFENSLMSVPNARLLDTSVNNYGLRQYRRFKTTIQITYNTPPDKIEIFVEHLRKITELHPCTVNDRTQIHFNNMSESSLDILFYTFFDVVDWEVELKAKQEILLAIMELAQQMDISFAYPSISVYQSNEGKKSQSRNFDSTSFIEDYQKTLSDSYDQT